MATNAPIDLATLKEDLNIPASDTSQDAWLQRHINNIWARMEKFCDRRLCAPPATFIDDWGELTINGTHWNVPPPLAYPQRTTVFLRHIPVQTITAIELNGDAVATLAPKWDIHSGKLFSVRGDSVLAEDLSGVLLGARAKITYTAGWAEVPPDLYAVVEGAMQVLWNGRQGQTAGGLGGGSISEVNVMDVGSVQFAATNPFVESASRTRASPMVGADPLLGPWAANLTDYIDWRSSLGVDCFPTTKDGPP
jgi:hypothetical protein